MTTNYDATAAMEIVNAAAPGVAVVEDGVLFLEPSGLDGAVLASDGFFPHRDSIDVARRCGVRYIVQPGGSLRDSDVIGACDEHGLVMAMTGLRLFHH